MSEPDLPVPPEVQRDLRQQRRKERLNPPEVEAVEHRFRFNAGTQADPGRAVQRRRGIPRGPGDPKA